MEQYCKLPIPITAYQTDKEIDIETLEGTMHASVGDYIITGVNGEQYPCKPDIFEKTYIKYGQANKMAQVAALFGKKLGEEFRVVSDNGLSCICRFDENNILEFKDMRGRWTQNHAINYVMIGELLKGKANIVEG